jgi:hypothetical protein
LFGPRLRSGPQGARVSLNSIDIGTAVFTMHGSTPRSAVRSLHNAVLRQCTALLCVATASAVTVSKKKQKTKADLKI